ncbi:GAF domain-containing protein [Nocardia takedensis]|uniref:GAF domain-containing protein n=1 Tax=Nocardia takedensis TaxID=259390 RepID=UPI000306FA3E|nr:GAF domain-containing protein [Nocardia takedensis]
MWYLIDAAEPDRGIRQVPGEGGVRERSLHRLVRPSSLAAVASSVVGQVIESNDRAEREVLVRGAIQHAYAEPVPGPDGAPLAVRLWVGAARRDQPPGIDVFVWDGGQWTVMSHGGGGTVLPGGHPMLHGAWFLSRIVECEDRDRLVAAALQAAPGVQWQGTMQVLTPDDRGAKVFGFFRYHAPGMLRGLLLQVEPAREPGLVAPTYHRDAAAALLGSTAALIDVETMQIIEWLTPPLTEIAWRHHPASRGVDPGEADTFDLVTTHLVHPDDFEIYGRTLMSLACEQVERARLVVRLLTISREWCAVELTCIRLPRGLPRFLTCLIRPVPSDTPPGVAVWGGGSANPA